jgi:hypothetical protein
MRAREGDVMKRKIIAILLGVVMVMAMLPVMTFAASEGISGLRVDSREVDYDDEGYALDQEGEGWSYSNGVLTLDGYDGGHIKAYSYFNKLETLTVVLVNENKVTAYGGIGIQAQDGVSLVFQGSGSLQVEGEVSMFGIDVSDGKLTFDLSEGGEVAVNVSPWDGNFGPQSVERVAPGLEHPEILAAVAAYDNDGPFFTATSDKITLNANNVITNPENGVVALHTIVDSSPIYPIINEATEPEAMPADRQSEPNNQSVIATIKAKPEGELTASTTITGVAPSPEEPEKEPIKEPTKGETVKNSAGTVKKSKSPKTGDEDITGMVMVLMVAGAATAVGMARRKYN